MTTLHDTPIADALVLTFTRGLSLAEWKRLGMLEREWALYDRLAPLYGRLLFVSYGGGEDAEIGRELNPRLTVLCNGEGLPADAYTAGIPARVQELLGDATTVVVKTNQMEGGLVAVRIAERLRASGKRVGLVARGGYLWSRFVASDKGPSSPEARGAAEQEQELCRAADMVVGTSRTMLDDLSWRFGIDPERTALIPNFVVAEGSVRTAEERDGSTVLYAGQLVARKRVDVLVEAIARMPGPVRAKTTLSIVGEGPEEPRLRELAGRLDVRTTIESRVPHGELLERMGRCGVYAQASCLEGHPKTVIEAMSTGAPVVVAESPGLEGIVDHCLSGLCVPGTADAFSRAIGGLLKDSEWRGAIGGAAAREARDRYGLSRIIKLEEAAHRAALVGAGRAAPTAAGDVRWESALLLDSPEAQVEAWSRSLRGFARRLAPDRRAKFLMGLDTPFYHLQGESAVAAEGGLHPKHRLMRYHDFFVERIGRGEHVIDLGSGVGALAASIAERSGARVTGMDWTAANLEKARAIAAERGLSERLNYVEGDITKNRAAGRFDTVVLSNVLEHITERPSRLRMWREWYRPKRFLIRVPAFDREWRAPWKKELGVEWRLDPTHETEYTQAQLLEELAQSGLRLNEIVIRWGEYWVSAAAD